MVYQHGVYVYENPTSVTAPVFVDSAVQVVVGTAPVNLLADPAAAVNKPILVNSFAEAVSKMGYSNTFEDFTLCQTVDASFRVFNVSPLVLINVLDPAVHYADVAAALHNIVSSKVTIPVEGILDDANLVVKDDTGTTTYVKDTDYSISFDDDGYLVVSVISTGSIGAATQLQIAYRKLDPSAIDANDIIGSYAAGVHKGLENIEQVYPRFGKVPGLLIAPGWSHDVNVGVAMMAKSTNINGVFECMPILDIPTDAVTTYDAVKTWKDNNNYIDRNAIACWPMCKIGTKKYYMSTLIAVLTAYTDALNEGVPYVSPSNKSLKISGAILADDTEVYLDQSQANVLNAAGVVSSINHNGWKCWGNNTSIYPGSSDVKDRYIPVRRMFIWWKNTFILTYFQKVDDPANYRLIETIVDSENIRANGFKGRGQIADARIEFNIDENLDLTNGIIRFRQYLTPFTPAETIINTLEFDPNALTEALAGGE